MRQPAARHQEAPTLTEIRPISIISTAIAYHEIRNWKRKRSQRTAAKPLLAFNVVGDPDAVVVPERHGLPRAVSRLSIDSLLHP